MAAETDPASPEKKNNPDQQAPAVDGNGSAEAIPAHSATTLHAHHVSKILDEVLDEPEEEITRRRLKHPMVLDLILAVGLLAAMGGFTVGLFKMYLTHSAEQSITQHNYKAAIAILKGAPVPGFFAIPGADPDELLNQALYLDAMDKLEVDNDVDGAMKELQAIRAGSRYFALAQEIIEENYTPSVTTLQGGASVAAPGGQVIEKKPILPDAPKRRESLVSQVYSKVYEIVRQIPPGKVLTYGLISNLIGGRLSAQGVGWALQALGRTSSQAGDRSLQVPWHRVINSRGQLSTQKNSGIPPGLQRHLLEREGIEFDAEERLDLSRYLWRDGLLAAQKQASN